MAFIARLAALIPAPKRHTVRYCGVLASHSRVRSQVVPAPATPQPPPAATPPPPEQPKPPKTRRYIPRAQLLRRTFEIEIRCARCQSELRLIALITTESIVQKILAAMHLPTKAPQLHPARLPPKPAGAVDGGDWLD